MVMHNPPAPLEKRGEEKSPFGKGGFRGIAPWFFKITPAATHLTPGGTWGLDEI
jgi:hypothetical protein